MLKRLTIFLILNFCALAIGGFFTTDGVASDWYANLNKAPWTPPGWFFGFAWTTIMVCFAFYMSFLYKYISVRKLIILFSIQWILNVIWNPIFFHFNHPVLGLIAISLLSVLIAFMFFSYFKKLKWKSLFVFPYVIWLIIATSLNLYIVIMN